MRHKKAKTCNPQHSLTALNKPTDKACAEIMEMLQKSPGLEANGIGEFLLSQIKIEKIITTWG